jgi:hypothetical protein
MRAARHAFFLRQKGIKKLPASGSKNFFLN